MADTNMIKTGSYLAGELIDLRKEMALLTPTDTPLTTMLLGRGQVTDAKDITVTWRERELNADRGTLAVEGSEAGQSVKSSRQMHSNVCQILEKVTSVSGTARALAPLGIGDEFQREVEDRLIELKRDQEYYFINGVKTLENGSTPRQMGGLLNLVSATNVIDLSKKTANAGQLEENDLIDGMQKIWDAGAHGDYFLFANATEKRILNALLKNGVNSRFEMSAGDNTMGVMVQKIETDFGTLNVVLNRHMPKGKIMAVDLSLVEIAELRPTFYEDLAKTGDYSKGHVIVENTIKLLNSKAGMVITGITK